MLKGLFYLLSSLILSGASFFGFDEDVKKEKKNNNELTEEKRVNPDPNNQIKLPHQEISYNEVLSNKQSQSLGKMDRSFNLEKAVMMGHELEVVEESKDVELDIEVADNKKLDKPIKKKELAKVEKSVDKKENEIPSTILEKFTTEQADALKEEEKATKDIEVSGLIMDDTRSKIGHDFYEAFYNTWSARPQINKEYYIVIDEKPVRGSVSQVTVTVNEVVVMQQFVQMRGSEVEDYAEQAVGRAQGFLMNEENMREQLLEESDQMGSGLF